MSTPDFAPVAGGHTTAVFPGAVAYGSRSKAAFQTTVIATVAEHENRIGRVGQPLRNYDAGFAVKTHAQLYEIYQFHMVMRGRLYSFLLDDPLDFSSASTFAADGKTFAGVTNLDQAIGTGDAATTAFQLVKTYSVSGGTPFSRPIKFPIAGSVVVAVNGAAKTEGVDFTVSATTGIVTFTVAPGAGLAVTAGFRFRVPVRFDIDELDTAIETYGAGRPVNIPMVEVRDHA